MLGSFVTARIVTLIVVSGRHTCGVNSAGDFELTMNELRSVTAYAVACAKPTLGIATGATPDDQHAAAAIAAAETFAEGAARSNLQRTAAVAAYRSARDAPTEAARHVAMAAGDAAASAYLHPLRNATQVRHILGSAAHAACAVESVRGDDPVVAEYMLHAAAQRITPTVQAVLERYPRAPGGSMRVAILMQKLDSLIRDPAPQPKPVDDPGPFFHGTRADMGTGDLLAPGWDTNYGSGKKSGHIYLTASEFGAPLAAALAQGGGRPRVYRVQPLGPIFDDPNVTDKKFPGNPTRSYRTRGPLRVVGEVVDFTLPDSAVVERIQRNAAELKVFGIEALDD